MKYGELTLGQTEALVNKLGGMDAVKRILSGDLVVKAKEIVANVIQVLVDYGRSVEDAVMAGKYNWTNENITSKNFPTEQSGKTETIIKLVHFNKVMSTDAVLRAFDEQNLRPATLPELLAIGEQYPELQREFPIVELGSVWVGPGGYRDVACLSRGGAERGLDRDWCGGGWIGGCRFAAVSK